MKTVQDYLDLGVEFAKGDVVIGYKNIEYSKNWHESLQDDDSDEGDIWLDCNIKSFAWRNNDGVKPAYNGLIEILTKIDVYNGDNDPSIKHASDVDWRPHCCSHQVAKWRPVVLQSESDDLQNKLGSEISSVMGSVGLTAKGIINVLNGAFKPNPPFWNESMPRFNCPCVVVDIDEQVKKFTIKEEAPKTTMTVNIEGRDYLIASHKTTVSPKEDKPMKPVYTAEMHAKGKLPPVGAECILTVNNEPRPVKVTYIGKDIVCCSNVDDDAEYACFLELVSFKPIIKTIKVNGFDVPAPMSEAPECDSEYFIPSINNDEFVDYYHFNGDSYDKLWLSRGLVHSTKLAAIAHAKAMLGINPNPTRSGDGYDRNVLGQNNEGDEI